MIKCTTDVANIDTKLLKKINTAPRIAVERTDIFFDNDPVNSALTLNETLTKPMTMVKALVSPPTLLMKSLYIKLKHA